MSSKAPSALHVDDNPTNVVVARTAPQQERVTRMVVLFCLFILLNATVVSFDLGYGGTVLLMMPFNTAFGHCNEVADKAGNLVMMCQVTALQQSLISLTTIFIALGGAFTALSGTYTGRRGTIQIGSVLVAVGAAGMLGTTGSFTNYMVCKCINGFGQGFIYTGTIVYGVECTPPHRRGLLLSLYTIGLALGTAIAAGVCAGTASIPNNWAWKTPIIIQIPLALTVTVIVRLFPESPRWYLEKNKEEMGRKSLARFYQKDIQSHEVTAEVQEIQAYLEFERSTASTTSWTEIFHRKNIRRTLISTFYLIAANITGLQFVAPYAAIFLGAVGIGSPFLITAIITLCFFAGSFFGGFIIDFGGRRFAMIAGFSVLGSCMLIISAVSTGLGATSPVTQKVLIAFLCIWTFSFSAFIAPSTWIGATEVHSIRLRTYGQAFALNISQIFSFACQFWTPYMISPTYGNMGTNVGYFYFGIIVIVLIITLFFVPETARLKLEQIDDYFESGRPAWKTSTTRNKKIAAENLLVVIANDDHSNLEKV